jgi:hypothetical protein
MTLFRVYGNSESEIKRLIWLVQTESTQTGLTQTGSTQTESIHTGSIQTGSIQTGSIQTGSKIVLKRRVTPDVQSEQYIVRLKVKWRDIYARPN